MDTRAEHFVHFGVAKLSSAINFYGGATWLRIDLDETRLFQLARFIIKRIAHSNEHEHKDNGDNGYPHKDIRDSNT